MKAVRCAVCGSKAALTHRDVKGGVLYGASCENGHFIGDEFNTKNNAVRAWNECQSFLQRYTKED